MMTSFLGGGNDLADNLRENASSAPPDLKIRHNDPSLVECLLSYRNQLLAYSNLVRLIYLVDGPWIRSELSPFVHPAQLDEALQITSEQFAHLAQISHQYHFVCEIYLIEPMEDVINRTYPNTARAIATITHGLPLVDLGPILRKDPKRYYYRLDGHFTPAGHQAVAQFLVQQGHEPELK
jgi:hypothetical protein